ncbi:Protein CBG04580 [Caenorhabditis briggsae]|uniref:Protein CBG04580 n=1 Tax=Caenorhabditis briggsae TaxID=6238 RepID=A8WXZ4_CAEBR|nr:Protein CBG04580 [Caenorhabditis briggsae]CAP25254.2 Protein CBG04580 [Caenorhabditis briggsae]
MLQESERVENEEEYENDEERVSYLKSFIARLMAAPMKEKSKAEVDVAITKEEIRIISNYAAASFASFNTLMKIEEECLPIQIVGDLHGHFADLRRIFGKHGSPGMAHYVFLGDYVDRGRQGLETVMLLMAFHCLYPDHLFMCRGNHEDYNTTLTYGFYDECKMKYGEKGPLAWLHIINAFNHLPLAALIFGKVLCMHGGISPHIRTLEDIDNIQRPTFIPSYGLVCDLVWSDPEATTVIENQKNIVERKTKNTELREDLNAKKSRKQHWLVFVSSWNLISFDDVTIEKFCEENGIDLIVRAHQISSEMVTGGHKWHADGHMVTIFSAANYLSMGNDSCVLRIDEQKTVQFCLLRPVKKSRKH